MATNRFFRRLAQVLRETADLGAQSWRYEVSEPAGRPPSNSPPRVRAVTAASSGGLPPPLPTKGRPFASAPTATALAAVTNRALGAGVTDSHRLGTRIQAAHECRSQPRGWVGMIPHRADPDDGPRDAARRLQAPRCGTWPTTKPIPSAPRPITSILRPLVRQPPTSVTAD
jgi:hypothetical protein